MLLVSQQLATKTIFSAVGSDVVKDDGYYSAALFNFTSNGYFTVKVRTTAEGGNKTKLLTSGGNRAFRLYPSTASKPHMNVVSAQINK